MIWAVLAFYWVGITCYRAGLRQGRVVPPDFDRWARDTLSIGPERRAALVNYLHNRPISGP